MLVIGAKGFAKEMLEILHQNNNLKDLVLNLPIYIMPIEIELAPKDKFTFDKNILDYVASAKRIG